MNKEQMHDNFMGRIDTLFELEVGSEECERAFLRILEDIADCREQGLLPEVSVDHLYRTLEDAGFIL